MEEFKIGDKVRVKKHLLVGKTYDDGCKFVRDMEYALGKVGEIIRVVRNGRYVIKFDCEELYHGYCYSPSMLELVDNKLKVYRIGDDCPYDFPWAKVIITNNNNEVIAIDENFNVFELKNENRKIKEMIKWKSSKLEIK